LAANIMIEASNGTHTLEVLLDDQKGASYTTEITATGAIVPLSVFESMKVAKGTTIKLSLKSSTSNVKVLKYSSWSLGYIGKEVPGLQEFSVFMPNPQLEPPTAPTNTRYSTIKLDLRAAYNKIAGNHRGQFVSPIDFQFLDSKRRFSINQKANFFYVTADVHIAGEAEDIEVVIPVGLSNREIELQSKSLSSRKKKLAGKTETFSLSGCVVVADRQYLIIHIKAHDHKAFIVTEETYVAFIQMRYLTSSFSVKTNDLNAITFSNNAWNDLTGPFVTDEKGLFAFGGDFDFATGKFTASHTGIHSVEVNLNFETTNCNIPSALLQANLVVDDIGNEENGFYTMQQAPLGRDSLRLYGALNLNFGETVSLRVRLSGCASQYSVKAQFGVSYIGTEYIVSAFLGIQTENLHITDLTAMQYLNVSTAASENNSGTAFATDGTFDGVTYTSMEDAVFIVNAVVSVYNMNCPENTYVAIRVLVTGTNKQGTLLTNQPIDIQDVRYQKSGNFTLSLSTSLRLKEGEQVKIQLIESKAFPNDMIISGTSSVCSSISFARGSSFSVIRWSGTSEFSPEGYQNAGFLVRLDSSTNVDAGNWKTFAPNSLSSTHLVDLGLPAFYDIGNSLVQASSYFRVTTISRAGIYYVSGSITLSFEEDSDPFNSNYYEVCVNLNEKFVTGIRSTVYYTAESKFVGVSFAGTVYVMYGQTTSAIELSVKGLDNVYIQERSTFSVVKLQPDYKTPGFVAEVQSQALTSRSNTTSLRLEKWDTDNSKGLTVK